VLRKIFKKKSELIKKTDYATALLEWRPFAKQGDARAQFYLGVMYRKGEGGGVTNHSSRPE
jgi:TPR repeat protein